MRKCHRLTILAAAAAVLSAGPLFTGSARADALAVNTGLWEATMDMGAASAAMGATLSADQLAKLTPAQQEAVKKAFAAASAPRTFRRCITQAMLDKGLAAETSRHCTVTTVSAEAHAAEYQMACTGTKISSSGTIKLDAPDARTINSTMDGTITVAGGEPRPMHVTGVSHWLATDCGDVKPKE